jgi:serine/threonine protein kinase
VRAGSHAELRPALVMEFLECALFELLHKKMVPPDAAARQNIVHETAMGLEYLHSRQFMHRDIKTVRTAPTRGSPGSRSPAPGAHFLAAHADRACGPLMRQANVLVDKMGHAKVSDFGTATGRSGGNDHAALGGPEEQQHTVGVGTPRFMAPEVAREVLDASRRASAQHRRAYDERADVYSFGLLVWETAHVRVPWADVDGVQVAFVLAPSGQRPPLTPGSAPSLAAVYEPLAHLIASCWHKDPAQRPSMAACAQELGRLLQLLTAPAGSGSTTPEGTPTNPTQPGPSATFPAARADASYGGAAGLEREDTAKLVEASFCPI